MGTTHAFFNEKIKGLLLKSHEPSRKAISAVEEGNPKYGLCIIIDHEGSLVGVISSADIYRAVFAGYDLDVPAGDVCNKSPVVLRVDELQDINIVRDKIKILLALGALYIP